MFQAILHGKVRDNLANADLNSDWRSLYRQTEDFLTAAVFCHLTFLPARCALVDHSLSSYRRPADWLACACREFGSAGNSGRAGA